jgi:hypothetical protein
LHRDGYVARDPSLEELEHEQRERERRDEYVAALKRERVGVEVELARLRQLRPGFGQWAPGDDLARGEPPTASERVAAAEGRLRDIDAEIAGVEGDSAHGCRSPGGALGATGGPARATRLRSRFRRGPRRLPLLCKAGAGAVVCRTR